MKRASTKTSLYFFLFILAAVSCKKETIDPVPECTLSVEERGDRIIGYDILDVTETGDFGMNYDIASEQLKGDFIQLLQPWNSFENNQAGVYDGEAIQLYETLNGFANSTGTQLSIIITPIDIPGRFVPAYLSGKKFNDPLVIESFNNLIDRLFNPNNGIVDPDRVIALSVGNEIDQYNWAANGDQLSEYKEFLQAIKPNINAYGIPLHFTGTLYGMAQPGDSWIALANVVDKVSITYYPINADFTVKSPDVVFSDLATITTKFNDQELFIQEIGYPTSASLNSSEAKQAEFFCNFFSAWDSHQDQINHVSILRLNDVSLASAQATAITFGIPGNENFIEYIRTLGIRTWDKTGTNKMAFGVIEKEITRRDW